MADLLKEGLNAKQNLSAVLKRPLTPDTAKMIPVFRNARSQNGAIPYWKEGF